MVSNILCNATAIENDCENASKNHIKIKSNNCSRYVLSWLIVALLVPHSYGYNIDLPSYIKHTREPNTMFGFSIALHKGRNNNPESNSLVVGAPKFDTSSYQEGVLEAGAVFKCGMNDGDCNLIKFDSSGNLHNTYGDIIERKSYQWLGATVSTSRENDLIVACAPRYVFHTMTPTKSLRYDPVGTCFTSRNFTQFHEVSPCRTNSWGYHRQGYCQAGFSAAASRNGDRLYIGAPGSWYWQGQAYSISADASFPYKPPFYQPFGTGGQAYSYDVTRPENQVYSTAESLPQDDDSYLGYSMVTGDFNGDRIDDVAIGMPRGAGLLGKIVVNGWNMANIFNITGRQIGEYFGYSIATSDVDGDGWDDLLIGAPMYSEPGNAKGEYDVGRVYVLLQGGSNRWNTEHILDGYMTKGRFGLALTSLGDVNRDGYGDFAVGAPYDGPEGRGVVYIFHGSANGPLQKPSQIIKSEDIVEGAPFPRTFGFALSGGVDMDGNTYPDLAVGAYASDQVFIFKSRPVAAVNAMTTFINPSKLINLEEKNCQTVRDGKRVACTDIMSCWSYTGEYLPRNLEFDVSWVLDAKKTKNPRMFFLLDEGKNIRNQSISLPYGKTYCRNETVYLVDNVQDKLTPLEVEMRYNLRSSRYNSYTSRRKRDVLEPVIDQDREIVQRDAINIQKNCGADNICEPDLRLEIKTVDKYLLGSPEPLTIDVLISNMNEDAFEASFYMLMPKDLDFKKIQPIGDKSDTPITCTAPSESNNYTLKCDIGNPLPGRKVANFKVVMLPSTKIGMGPSYEFYMEANSTNVEKPGSHFDNIIRKSIGIWVETDLAIEGTSLPDFQIYKASDFLGVENATKEEDLGPQVVHFYNVRNHGPSIIEEAVIFIHYPHETIAGDLLMYITNQPETDGNIQCDPLVNVNTLNLKLDQNLVRKSYLEQIGAVVRTYGSSSTSATHIEKSFGQASGGRTAETTSTVTKELSVEEQRRLQKEDEQELASVHSQRANAAAEAFSGNRAGNARSWSSSWNASSHGNGPSVVVSSRNSSTYYDAAGVPHVVESSTEYVRNFDRSANIRRPPNHAENYQQAAYVQANSNRNGNVNVNVPYEQSTYTRYPTNHADNYHQSSYVQTNSNINSNSNSNRNGNVNGNVPYEQVYQQQVQSAPGGHSTRGHIQVAGSSSGYQPQYASYINPSGSSGGAYRPNQQTTLTSGHGTSNNENSAAFNTFSSSSDNLNKFASGNTGFRAGTLDLGNLQRGNVDQELRTAVNSGYQPMYGGDNRQQQGTGRTTHTFQHSMSNGKPYYGLENEDFYDEDVTNKQHSAEWSQSASSSQRLRRAAETNNIPLQIDLNAPCKSTKCETLRCVAKNLAKDDSVWIALRGRMIAKTMEKIAGSLPLNVSTMAVSHVTRLPYIGEPKDEIIRTHEIFYKAVPEPTPVPEIVPLWVVVLAACAGALILLLLVYLLYKCGFFNRNRPRDHSMERQPLRNGYQGDEHL